MAAIYMWLESEQLLLTTTLYPVVVTDSMDIAVSFSGGFLELIPASDQETSFDVQDGSLIQLRWFYSDGPYDSDQEASFDAQDGTLIQLRWFYSDGPYDSDQEATFSAHDGTLVNKLVTADTPDESLQLDIVVKASSFSMDLL